MRKGFLPLIPGSLMVIVLVAILAIVLLVPMLAITVSRELMLLFQIAASIVIISWVRNTVGPGMLSYAISAILIYIFVIILPQFTIGIWILWTFLGFGLWTMLFWGLTLFRRPA